MIPCRPSSGVCTKLVSLQRGHVGQPRPEPVRRTAPPVTTMIPFAIALARATRETTAGEKAGGTRRTNPMLGGAGMGTVAAEPSPRPVHPVLAVTHDERLLPRRLRQPVRRLL